MALEQQIPLPLDHGLPTWKNLKPKATAPKLWVEWMEVHKDFPDGDATRLRRIHLRPGLNILWATASRDVRGRLGGHGAGKTTFCRLLRYVLGDAKPGNRQFREAFRAQFPRGWVLADIWLDGQRWLVARPLGEVGHHPFAIRGGTVLEPIRDVDRAPYKVFEAAMDEVMLARIGPRELAGSGKKLIWPYVLTWLTRDQEAHYASLIEWRVRESESESEGSLSAPDRENLLLIMLGLVDSTEQERLREREKLTQEHERLVRERPQRAYHRSEAEKALVKLVTAPIGQPGELTFATGVAAEITRLRQGADKALMDTQDDTLLAKLTAEEATEKLGLDFVQEQILEMKSSLAQQRGTVETVSQRANDVKQKAEVRTFFPFRGYCSTPIEIARRDHCPCITSRPEDDEVDAAINQIISSVPPEADKLARCEERLRHLETDYLARQRKHAEVKTAIANRKQALRAILSAQSAPRDQASALDAAYRAWHAAEESVGKMTERLEELEQTKDILDAQIAAHVKAHKKRTEKFGDLFNLLVQTMLGDEVTGRIDFPGGKSIEPKLEFHGAFDSAALNLTKILAFDLAAIALAQFEGTGHHPGFLLHDSPRESDLAAPIYQSLFLAAKAMEAACGENISFQYIVTTTEPPPPEVNSAPWILDPVLDATEAGKRFLGVNL